MSVSRSLEVVIRVNQTHPDALFDEVILVSLQFILQPGCLRPDLSGRRLNPVLIFDGEWILRRDLLSQPDELKIFVDIPPLFGFLESKAESVDAKVA